MVPAICNECQILFISGIGVSAGTTLFSNVRTNCPSCGKTDAKILDGQWNGDEGAFQAWNGLRFTSRQQHQVRSAVDAISTKPGITDDVIEILDAVDPALGATAKYLRQSKYGKAVLVAALMLLLAKCEGSSAPWVDMSTHTTIIQQVAPRIEDSILYYPHTPADYKKGSST
jgi:hypothetical protein